MLIGLRGEEQEGGGASHCMFWLHLAAGSKKAVGGPLVKRPPLAHVLSKRSLPGASGPPVPAAGTANGDGGAEEKDVSPTAAASGYAGALSF
jgi:hypothetical protein